MVTLFDNYLIWPSEQPWSSSHYSHFNILSISTYLIWSLQLKRLEAIQPQPVDNVAMSEIYNPWFPKFLFSYNLHFSSHSHSYPLTPKILLGSCCYTVMLLFLPFYLFKYLKGCLHSEISILSNYHSFCPFFNYPCFKPQQNGI